MAGTTRYHRLPETDSNRASVDEDVRLLDPLNDNNDDPAPPKQGLILSFHPTLYFRIVVLILLFVSVIIHIIAHRAHRVFIIVITFFAIARNIWVILHHLLTQVISIRIRVELRRTGSSISSKRKSTWPKWLSGRAIVEVLIDLTLIALLFGATVNSSNDFRKYYGEDLGAQVILSYIAAGLNVFTFVDMGRPSRITIACTVNVGDDKPSKPPARPIYHDVEATGAGEVGIQSRKTGADSPPGMI